MKVRSLSQLPSLTSQFDAGIVEVSVPNVDGNRWDSYKVPLSSIESTTSAYTDDQMRSKYSLFSNDGSDANVNKIGTDVNKMLLSACTIDGVKQLTDWPWISAAFPSADADKYGGTTDNILPNVKKVKSLIENTPVYMSTTDSFVADGNPFGTQQYFIDGKTNSPAPKGMVQSYIASGKFYGWKIDIGGNDSARAIVDQASQSTDGYEMMRDTGNLVAWGWVSPQSKSIDSKYAWVALFGQVKCQNGDTIQTINVPIQVRPYIMNTGMAFQYVGFNVPVRAGMRLKVMTGFPCGGEYTGANQEIGSLTFSDAWIPNAFCGYIIK